MPLSEMMPWFLAVTEQAALACAESRGMGDREHADRLAVQAMREVLSASPFHVRVVIGEGERDEAPMLFIGEELGQRLTGYPAVDLAVDPLEGTNMCAMDTPGALTVLAVAPQGCLLQAPDTYMHKVVVGPEARDVIDLDAPAADGVRKVAHAMGRTVQELTVAVLDRERHHDLIRDIRATGARIRLFTDGDLGAGLQTSMTGTGVDLLMGSGGAPEGVLTAVAMRCLGGEILGRLVVRDDKDRERMKRMGIEHPERVYASEDLARGDDMLFVATGVTTGPLLEGVMAGQDMAETHSLILDYHTASQRYIHTLHAVEHDTHFH